MILTDADELRETLRVALQERDEANEEVVALKDERLRLRTESMRLTRERDEARAELLSIAQQLELEREASAQLRAELGERMRETAEAQREACAGAAFTAISLHPEPSPRSAFREAVVDAVEAAPLVTEGES